MEERFLETKTLLIQICGQARSVEAGLYWQTYFFDRLISRMADTYNIDLSITWKYDLWNKITPVVKEEVTNSTLVPIDTRIVSSCIKSHITNAQITFHDYELVDTVWREVEKFKSSMTRQTFDSNFSQVICRGAAYETVNDEYDYHILLRTDAILKPSDDFVNGLAKEFYNNYFSQGNVSYTTDLVKVENLHFCSLHGFRSNDIFTISGSKGLPKMFFNWQTKLLGWIKDRINAHGHEFPLMSGPHEINNGFIFSSATSGLIDQSITLYPHPFADVTIVRDKWSVMALDVITEDLFDDIRDRFLNSHA